MRFTNWHSEWTYRKYIVTLVNKYHHSVLIIIESCMHKPRRGKLHVSNQWLGLSPSYLQFIFNIKNIKLTILIIILLMCFFSFQSMLLLATMELAFLFSAPSELYERYDHHIIWMNIYMIVHLFVVNFNDWCFANSICLPSCTVKISQLQSSISLRLSLPA